MKIMDCNIIFSIINIRINISKYDINTIKKKFKIIIIIISVLIYDFFINKKSNKKFNVIVNNFLFIKFLIINHHLNLLFFLNKGYFLENDSICLCVIGKKENLYAKEYINHYKNLGYDHIFIYDNNEINDEKFSDILQRELKNGFVSIINFIGYKAKSSSTQVEAYFDCYKRNNRNYNWL